MQTVCNT